MNTHTDTQKKQMTADKPMTAKRKQVKTLPRNLPGRRTHCVQWIPEIVLFSIITASLVLTGAAAADVTVTFNPGDGSGPTYTQMITSAEQTPLMLNRFEAPSPEQYFLKWRDNNGRYYADGQAISDSGNQFEAVWTGATDVSSSDIDEIFPGNQISEDGYYRMTTDITLTSPLTLSNGTIAVLDLNGHILKGNGNDSVIKLITDDSYSGGCHLKLIDSAPYREHTPVIADTGSGAEETVTVTGGCITGGNAAKGGGVYVKGNCTFTMCGGTIVGNCAANGGGGIMIDKSQSILAGSVFMCGGKIAGNTVSNENGGGGVQIGEGVFTMTGGEITGNCAGSGGGVYINKGILAMTGGGITGNNAESGGGVYIRSENGVFRVSDAATVKDNHNSNVCLSGAAMVTLTGDLTGTIVISKVKSPVSGEKFGTAAGTFRGAENIIYDGGPDALYGRIDETKPYSLIWTNIIPTTLTLMDGSTEYMKINCSTGSAFAFPKPPEKAGRTCSGWKDSAGNWFCICSGEENLFFTKSAYYTNDEIWVYPQTSRTLCAVWDEISPVIQHSISVSGTEHGAVSSSYAAAPEGTEIRITAFPAAGYTFKNWVVSGVSVSSANPAQFTMPDSDVSVSAVFETDSTVPEQEQGKEPGQGQEHGPGQEEEPGQEHEPGQEEEPEQEEEQGQEHEPGQEEEQGQESGSKTGEMTIIYEAGKSASYSVEIPAELPLKKGEMNDTAIAVTFTTQPAEGEQVVVRLTSADADPDDMKRFLLKHTEDETRTIGYRIAAAQSFEDESLIQTGTAVLSAAEDTAQTLYFKLTEEPVFAGTYKGTVTFTAALEDMTPEDTPAEEAALTAGRPFSEDDSSACSASSTRGSTSGNNT